MTRVFSRWVPPIACVVFAAFAGYSALLLGPADRMLDLQIYHGAVRSLFAGGDAYSFSIIGYPFTYPPFALLALSPTWLPVGPMQALSLAASAAAVWFISRTVAAHWPERWLGRWQVDRRTVTWCIAAALFASGPVRAHTAFGQISVYVVALTFADAAGRPGRRWGGVAIGMCAAVKLTPLLFLPWLLVVGRGRDAARAAGAFLVCTSLTWVLLPTESAYYWGTAVRQAGRVGDLASAVNQSLHGVLLRTDLPGPTETVVWLALGAAICVVALIRARAAHRAGLVAESAVLAGCASLVVSPVTWSHHESWVVLAGVLMVASARGSRRDRLRVLLGAAVVVVTAISVTDAAPHLVGTPFAWLHWPVENARALLSAAICLCAFRVHDPDLEEPATASPSYGVSSLERSSLVDASGAPSPVR